MCTEKEYVCIDLFVHPCSGGKCLVPPCNISCWSSGCHWTAFDAVRFGIGSSLWVKRRAPYIESGATESVLPALHKPHVYARTSEFLKVPHCIGIRYACGVSLLLFFLELRFLSLSLFPPFSNAMLYTTGYSDGQQQQLNDDDDDDESGALCIHSPSYGSTAIHHSSPPPPPPPPPQAFVSMDHPCRRPSKPSTDLVLPALDPKYITNPQ